MLLFEYPQRTDLQLAGKTGWRAQEQLPVCAADVHIIVADQGRAAVNKPQCQIGLS